MKQLIKIGVVCLARKTFDYIEAGNIFKDLKQMLETIEDIEWEFINNLIFEIEDAREAGHYLASKEIDGLVCISGTFALGHLILEINKLQ